MPIAQGIRVAPPARTAAGLPSAMIRPWCITAIISGMEITAATSGLTVRSVRIGALDRIYPLKGVRSKPSVKNPNGLVRNGLKKCGHCRQQFTASVGMVFVSSHLPLHLWLQAAHLLCSSKEGISSHQLHRILKVTYQAARFASRRLREAMRSGELAPMGGTGSSGIVEADETFFGRKKGMPKRRAYHHKNAVLSIVERGGTVRSFHVANTDAKTIMPIVRQNVAKEARVMTDEAKFQGDGADDEVRRNVGAALEGEVASLVSKDEPSRHRAHRMAEKTQIANNTLCRSSRKRLLLSSTASSSMPPANLAATKTLPPSIKC